jgi:hypothetical protein
MLWLFSLGTPLFYRKGRKGGPKGAKLNCPAFQKNSKLMLWLFSLGTPLFYRKRRKGRAKGAKLARRRITGLSRKIVFLRTENFLAP